MCPKRLASPAKQTSRLPGAAILGAKGRAPEEPRHRRGAAGDSCSAPFLARICHAQRWRITCRPVRSPYRLRNKEACYAPSILLRFCSSSSRSSPHGIRPGIKGLTPFSLRAFGRDKNGAERGKCPTLMVRHTENAGLFEKPHITHHQCARSACPSPAKSSSRLAGRRASMARRAEHARSHGTAASAAGIFCCAPFFASTVAGA